MCSERSIEVMLKAALNNNLKVVECSAGDKFSRDRDHDKLRRGLLTKSSLVRSEWMGSLIHINDMNVKRPDFWKEMSYTGCVDWKFDIVESLLTVTMWDGDSFRGNRTFERCLWQFKLNTSEHERVFKELICPAIRDCLAIRARREFDRREQDRKDQAVRAIFESYFQGD